MRIGPCSGCGGYTANDGHAPATCHVARDEERRHLADAELIETEVVEATSKDCVRLGAVVLPGAWIGCRVRITRIDS